LNADMGESFGIHTFGHDQVDALVGFLDAIGVPLSHIKPHGALYGMTAREPRLMHGVCDAAAQHGVPVLGMPGTGHEKIAGQRAVPFIAEFYVDLGYDDASALVIRTAPLGHGPRRGGRQGKPGAQ